ncbi:MAG: molecular chaperone HtpG, partial [Cyanobacteria bacterium P01_C01_bin.38]
VSRSALQGDRTVKRIGDYIAKKVGDRLKQLYRDDREQYINAWKDLATFVKFGVMNDEKFQKQVEDIVVFRTTKESENTENKAEPAETPAVEVQSQEGDVWQDVTPGGEGDKNPESAPQAKLPYVTIKEYLERNKESHENRVFYCTDEASQAAYVELHKNQGLEVLYLDSFIDTHFINFLEREYNEVKFTRVDSDLDNTLLDKDKSSEIVDPTTNKTRGDTIKEIFEKALNKPKLNIRTEALKSDNPQGTPPAMVLLPEILRRLREMNAMMQQQNVEFPEEHVLLVNTAHPLIQNLENLNQGSIIQSDGQSSNAEIVNSICQHVYDLALMSQKGFDADGMKSFVERSNEVLTKLTQQAAK